MYALTLAALLLSGAVQAALPVPILEPDAIDAAVSWQPSIDSVDGYRIYWGELGQALDNTYDAQTRTEVSLIEMGIDTAGIYNVAAKSYQGVEESALSKSVTFVLSQIVTGDGAAEVERLNAALNQLQAALTAGMEERKGLAAQVDRLAQDKQALSSQINNYKKQITALEAEQGDSSKALKDMRKKYNALVKDIKAVVQDL